MGLEKCCDLLSCVYVAPSQEYTVGSEISQFSSNVFNYHEIFFARFSGYVYHCGNS
jgi:hypothetical protein